MKKRRIVLLQIIGLVATAAIWGSCRKDVVLKDPYGGGKEPLAVSFRDAGPSPSKGSSGEEMTFMVDGALPFASQLKFYMNYTEAEVVSVTDSTITAILPDHVSTGGVYLNVNGQIFAGPSFGVKGKVEVDPTFYAGTGINGTVLTIEPLSNGQLMLGGFFHDYNGNSANASINNIVRIASNGDFIADMDFGEGPDGIVSAIHELEDGKFLIGGNFFKYDTIQLVNNITRINATGSLDRTSVEVLNLTDDPLNSYATVPSFNGGTIGSVQNMFVHDDKITAIGNFSNYVSYYFPRSTVDNFLQDGITMSNMLRMDMNGALDSTFHLNRDLNAQPYAGLNGSVQNAIMQQDGKIILVGSFTRFDNTHIANRIMRVNLDGTFDGTFQVGSGADAYISNINYNGTTHKYIITGGFKTFNGVPANGLAILDEEGHLDPGFQPKAFTGGNPNYATMLTNGLIVVTGSFDHYDQIVREGLCVLNADGSLAADYNNTGKFIGSVSDSYESVNNLGQRTLLLAGFISRFDGHDTGNIVRLVIYD